VVDNAGVDNVARRCRGGKRGSGEVAIKPGGSLAGWRIITTSRNHTGTSNNSTHLEKTSIPVMAVNYCNCVRRRLRPTEDWGSGSDEAEETEFPTAPATKPSASDSAVADPPAQEEFCEVCLVAPREGFALVLRSRWCCVFFSKDMVNWKKTVTATDNRHCLAFVLFFRMSHRVTFYVYFVRLIPS